MSDIIGSQFSYTQLRNAGSYDNSRVKEIKRIFLFWKQWKDMRRGD